MNRRDSQLNILIYARNTKATEVWQIIEQLERIAPAFHGIQVYVCASKVLRFSKPYIEQVEFGADIRLLEEPVLQKLNLVVVEGLSRSDLDLLSGLMLQEVPVVVAENVAASYPEILIPGRTVKTYVSSQLLQLPMIIVRFLRNIAERKQILKEARACALDRLNSEEKMVILREAALTCEQPTVKVGKTSQLAEAPAGCDPLPQNAVNGEARKRGSGTGFVCCGVLNFNPKEEQNPVWRKHTKVYSRRVRVIQETISPVNECPVDTAPEAEVLKDRQGWRVAQALAKSLMQKLFAWGRSLPEPAELFGKGGISYGQAEGTDDTQAVEAEAQRPGKSTEGTKRENVLGEGEVQRSGKSVEASRPESKIAEQSADTKAEEAIPQQEQVDANPEVGNQLTPGAALPGPQAARDQQATNHIPIENSTAHQHLSKDSAGQQTGAAADRSVQEKSQAIEQHHVTAGAIPEDKPTSATEVALPTAGRALEEAVIQPGKVEKAPEPEPTTRPCHRKEYWEERVDLVIISYNTLRYLRECLQSIRLNTQYPYRIIVVDNGSTDGSVEFLRRNQDVLLIANRENYGYARACNQGIMAGRGEFVAVMNSDVKVFAGWLKGLVETAKSDAHIGVVGPKMVNEWRQIVGAGVTRLDQYCSSRGWLEADGPNTYMHDEDCYSVGGACYLIRREALAETGLFDESFFFYFEESDLSLRMLERGYRVVYTPRVTILHHHEGSLEQNNRSDRLKRNQYFTASQRQFVRKWTPVINGAPHRPVGKDILVFGLIHWHFRYQRPQQICNRLVEMGYRVLYINNTCQPGGHLEQINDSLRIFSPDGNAVVYRLLENHQACAKVVQSIRLTIEDLQVENPVLWVDAPYWEPVAQHFDRGMLIYNCMDAYADFADLRQYCPEVKRLEEEIVRAADLVLASSRPLQSKLQELGAEVHLIPNAADCAHFRLEGSMSRPADLAAIPEPVCGYYGAIAEWLDLDLLKYAVERLPQTSFVLIGEHTVDIECLRAYPNTYFLGEKPYALLPEYLEHFQVAMIPFKQNELTRSTNPVKLYEYLAAGKPVVSVDLPEVRRFAGVVRIAQDYEEFVHCLQESVEQETPGNREKRQQSVEDEDWQNRVQEICRLMQETETALIRLSRFPELARLRKEGEG